MSLADDFASFVSRLWADFLHTIAEIFDISAGIITLKARIHKDLEDIVLVAKGIYADEQAFLDRAKHLKKHVIRADVAFEFVNDLRSGKLKDFVFRDLVFAQSAVADAFDEVVNELDSIRKDVPGAGKVFNFALFEKYVQGARAIYQGYEIIQTITNTLRDLKPVLQEIRDVISRYEGVIMPQNSRRHTIYLNESKSRFTKSRRLRRVRYKTEFGD